MKYIENDSCDIYFNLAMEEYVFNNFKDDTYLLLWKNDDSIVLGKFQNAFEEINIRSTEKLNIKVARRKTGGGTVFHDRGNLNYSIISDHHKNSFIDYNMFINPVISALNSMGVHAQKNRTCDIAIDGKKISGSAQSIKGDRVLHHGTLLFDADLSRMHDLLKAAEGDFLSRSVKSVRSTVTNIKEHLDDDTMTIDDFKILLLKAMFPDGLQRVILSEEQHKEVSDLAENKYSKWQWNYGSSPEFTYKKESRILNKLININLNVKKGMVETCEIKGDNLPCRALETTVTGSRYTYMDIVNKLKEIKTLENIKNINIEELAECFF